MQYNGATFADTCTYGDHGRLTGYRTGTVNHAIGYAWRKHFGSLEPSDVKRLRQLEQENSRLKKMVATAISRSTS